MSSPFSSAKEFLEAKGPIYTFANNSTAIGVFLILSLAITIYFFYASFAMYQKEKSKTDPAMMGVLLVAGLATSLASSLMGTEQKKQPVTTYHQDLRYERQAEHRNNSQGLFMGLFGVAAKGKPVFRRSRSRNRLRR
jgi:hypothetical protein